VVLVGDIATGDLGGAIENVTDLTQTAAPILSLVDAVVGIPDGAGAGLLEQFASLEVTKLTDEAKSKASKFAAGGSSGTIFEQIALVMGGLAGEKADEISKLAESLGSAKDGDIIKNATLLSARVQELGTMTKASSEAINQLGQSVQQAAGK